MDPGRRRPRPVQYLQYKHRRKFGDGDPHERPFAFQNAAGSHVIWSLTNPSLNYNDVLT